MGSLDAISIQPLRDKIQLTLTGRPGRLATGCRCSGRFYNWDGPLQSQRSRRRRAAANPFLAWLPLATRSPVRPGRTCSCSSPAPCRRRAGILGRRAVPGFPHLLPGSGPGAAKLATIMDHAEPDVLAHMTFPKEHRAKLHSRNPIERLNGEIKRRTEVVGSLPERRSHRAPCRRNPARMGSAAGQIHDAGNDQPDER